MKHARIAWAGAVHSAVADGDQLRLADGTRLAEDEVVWLPPVVPGTIIALGINYADHKKELAKELTLSAKDEPLAFLKGPNALVGHRGRTRRPADATFMHYECELAVVIGRHAKRVKRADALAACRRLHHRQRLRDPRLPGELVPAQPAREEPRRLHRARPLAGRCRRRARPACAGACAPSSTATLKQQGNTRDLIDDVPALIEYLSSFMTLSPGDIILTGTPEGVVNVDARRRGGVRDRRPGPAAQHHRRRRPEHARTLRCASPT